MRQPTAAHVHSTSRRRMREGSKEALLVFVVVLQVGSSRHVSNCSAETTVKWSVHTLPACRLISAG